MAIDEFAIPSCVEEKLKKLGYELSGSMKGYIQKWYAWYTGDHRFYKVKYVSADKKRKERQRYSLRPARKVCREWASLILNEDTQISVEDEQANAWLQEYLDKSGFWVLGQMAIEKAFAMGTGAWALWFKITDDVVTDIKIRRYDARMVVPLSWDEDGVSECAFVTRVSIRGKLYTQAQVHAWDDDTSTYHIKTYLFDKDGKEVDTEDLGIIDDFDTRQCCQTFGIVKPGIDNVVVDLSPFGMSVFNDAIDAIRATDLTWDSIFQEIDLTRVRVFLSEEMIDLKDKDGHKIPIADIDDMVYRMVYDKGAENLIEVFSPDIRIEPLKDALNIALSQLGDNCGFGEQYFQIDKAGGVKTATEVVSDNSTLMRNVRKHENSIGKAITDIITGLLSCAAANGFAEVGNFGVVNIKFDDSVIVDTQTEKRTMLDEIAAGVVPKWMFLVTFYGKTEEEAKAAIGEYFDDEGF